ncbi:GIY-YIG nuclease family protein [Massilia orientalis]|uniref:GIY-YIG nuclease family protein n=1 Tax=Massilia orientalis TaxID=3050128 RepID=UPI0037DD72BF
MAPTTPTTTPPKVDCDTADMLRNWVHTHGSRAGQVHARAYELTKESRANLLIKGTVIVTDGRETDLATVKGTLLRRVFEHGASASPTTISGLKNKLKEIPDFWKTNLGLDVAVAPLKKIGSSKAKAVSRDFVVYVTKNIVTGRMYFGSSKSVHKRWASHRRDIAKLTHTNPELLADARDHGPASFKFFVVSRCTTREEMLRREQVLIAMYFNREACYNKNSSVAPDKIAVPVQIRVIDRDGGSTEHSFLTLHAAIRHYRLSKAAVRKAIAAGHGKVGPFRFPIGIPITEFRVRRVGQRSERPAPQTAPVPAMHERASPSMSQRTYYDRLKSILDKQSITLAELSRILAARTTTMSLWSTKNPPTWPQEAVLGLIERFGFEWVNSVPMPESTAKALSTRRAEYQIAWTELDAVIGLRSGHAKQIAHGDIAPGKCERLLVAVLAHHGLESFTA